ncbi:MAG TPA: TonB-dependent receptor [Enhygromyxa sp.]|nr:TonB-dependent receptor [Enhygromyxa sp.]
MTAARPTRAASPPEPSEPDDEPREIVVPTQSGPSVSSRTIDATELAATPMRTAEDGLRLVPGLVLVQHGAEGKGQQYFLRGFDAVHGLDFEIEADGIPLNEWSNVHAQGYLDLGLLIPELITAIDVTPGPFALDQGPFALAGSARFRLGVPESSRGLRASVEFGSTLRERTVVSYSPRDGDGSRFVALELMNDRGFGEGRDSRRVAVMARQHLVDRPTSAGRLSALLLGQMAEFGLPGTTRLSEVEAGRIDFYGAHDPGHGTSQRAVAALDWQLTRSDHRLRALAWTGARRLALVENFTGFLERPVLGDRREQLHQAIPFGVRIDHAWAIGPRLELDSGVGVRGDVLEQREDRLDQLGRPFERTRAAKAVQADTWLLAGLRWQATEQLMLGAGTRLDVLTVSATDRLPTSVTRRGVRVAASPRVDLRWSPLASLELIAAYGRGFRPPEARAFTSFDPELEGISSDREAGGPRVSASDSGELGLRWANGSLIELRVAGFATHLARESIYDHVSRTNLQLAATRRLGLELSLASQPLRWLHVAGSVTYVDARFVRSRNPVPLAPALVGSLRSWLAHPLGLRAGLMLVGWTPRPLPYGASGSGFVRLDGTLGWHLEHVWVDLALENLLGMKLREGEYYFASDWSVAGNGSVLPSLHYVPGPPFNARLMLTLLW